MSKGAKNGPIPEVNLVVSGFLHIFDEKYAAYG